MSQEELEKLAAQGAEMPDSLNGAEQLMFLSLRQLYAIFRTGKLQKDIAKAEKMKILKEYEVNSLLLRSWEYARQKEIRLAPLISKINKSGCELCKKVVKILSVGKDD